jgi:hypothetical protein
MGYSGPWGTLIHEKKLKSKISCQTRFKGGKANIQSWMCFGQVPLFEIRRNFYFALDVEFQKESSLRTEVDLYPKKSKCFALEKCVEYLNFWHFHFLLEKDVNFPPKILHKPYMRMRSSLVVKASDCQCPSCNGPGFDPSIRRHSGIWGAADEAVLNIVRIISKYLCNFYLSSFSTS